MSKARIIGIARKILLRELDIVEGSREISRARVGLPDSELQADVLLPFIAFESELHRFPIGASRQYWNERALAALDKELQQIVASAEPDMRSACVNLLKAWR